MKAVSVSAELTTIQRAVEGAVLLVDIGRQGGVEDEDTAALVGAVLALTACRLRDLGRAVRGRMPLELFVAPHNEAIPGVGEEDVTLRVRGCKASTK